MNGLFNRGSNPSTKLGSFDIEGDLLTDQFPLDLNSLLLSNDISNLLLPLDDDSSQKYLDEDITQDVGSTETSFDSHLLHEFDSQKSLLESELQYENYSKLDKMLEVWSNADDQNQESNQKLDNLPLTDKKLKDASEIDSLLEVCSEAIDSHIVYPNAEEKLKIYPTVDEKPSLYTGLDQNIKIYPMVDQNSKIHRATSEILGFLPEQSKKQITSTHQKSQSVYLKQMPENKVKFKRQSYNLPSTLLMSNNDVVGVSCSSSSSTAENQNCTTNKKPRLAGEISRTGQIPLTAGEISAIEKYNERRRRNNIASRKSRENRKKKNQNDLMELEELHTNNERLKLKVKDLEECLEMTKAKLVNALM